VVVVMVSHQFHRRVFLRSGGMRVVLLSLLQAATAQAQALESKTKNE
jgi:hypothetical protein